MQPDTTTPAITLTMDTDDFTSLVASTMQWNREFAEQDRWAPWGSGREQPPPGVSASVFLSRWRPAHHWKWVHFVEFGAPTLLVRAYLTSNGHPFDLISDEADHGDGTALMAFLTDYVVHDWTKDRRQKQCAACGTWHYADETCPCRTLLTTEGPTEGTTPGASAPLP